MKATRSLLFLVISLMIFSPAVIFADGGAPDSIALEIHPPAVGSVNGTLRADLYCFNDEDRLDGISVGFRWESDWLRLDSALSQVEAWDAEFLVNTSFEQDNREQVMLYAGIVINSSNQLPVSPTRQLLASYYFTLERWLPGDQVLFDTSEFYDGAAMLMAYQMGVTIIPVWAGGDSPIVISAGSVNERSLWHVNHDATPGGNGSRERPLTTLGQAFGLASDHDTILVYPGHYTGSENRDLDFDQRNLVVRSLEGPSRTILDGEGASLLFYIPGGHITYPVIDGFTFQDGFANRGGIGGAIRSFGAALHLANSVFTRCTANYGGALYLNGNQYRDPADADSAHMVVISNCTFVGNHANNIGSAIYYQYNELHLNISHSLFYANKAEAGAPVDHDGTHVGGASASLVATDIFANKPADWVGSIGDHLGHLGNFSADPLFCPGEAPDFSIAATSPCAPENAPFRELIGAVGVGCVGPGGNEDEIIPTNEWINIYCTDRIGVEGSRIRRGALIRAFDPDGVLCGMGRLDSVGRLPMFPIYRDDVFTDRDEGAEPGDKISFMIDEMEVDTEPVVVWTRNGESFEVCHFRQACLRIKLHEGWNLISWNRRFKADPNQFLSKMRGCIDVVLSFEQGGLTWDPELGEFSSLKWLDYHHGYWFKMNCPATLEICGPSIKPNESIPVEQGWNLLSYWPDTAMNSHNGFLLATNIIELAIGFEREALVWMPDQDMFNTLTELKPGLGYWAKMKAPFSFAWPGFNLADSIPAIDFYNGGIDLLGGGEQQADATLIPPSRQWISAYGSDITLDGIELADRTQITFHSNGQICGQGTYQNHRLIFTPIYGRDDQVGVTALYPESHNQIQIMIDSKEVTETLTWTEPGERVRLGKLSTTVPLPKVYTLSQNYPNPFNPETLIEFTLPDPGHVRLQLFNVLGQSVRTLIDADIEAGRQSISWDGRDDSGRPVASGIYLYRLDTGSFSQTKKMILSK